MENKELVIRMEDILNKEAKPDANDDTNKSSPTKKIKKEKSFENQVPKGRPKSGRIWKEQKTKFSSIVKTRGIRSSLEKKQQLREDLKRVKEMSRAIKEGRRAEKEAKKQRRIENLKRAEENRKKSEVVQVITNTAKLKRSKKKQLRMIQKRDTVKIQN